MAKKILCAVISLAIFYALPPARTDLASSVMYTSPADPTDDFSETDEILSAPGEAAGLPASEDTSLDDAKTQGSDDIDEPDKKPAAKKPKAKNKDGTYTLSLTSSMGILTYFNQGDSRWVDHSYGGRDRFGKYGCGPTVLAMIVTSFTNQDYFPSDMADWASDHGYWAPGSGTKHSFIPEGAAAFGFQVESFHDFTRKGILDELASGHILVALLGPGHFTNGGHFIIIADDWSDKKVSIADPASLKNTQKAWDIELILDELKYSATDGGPMWSISVR
ncbi:MAG TPA: hypothetical protein DF613_07355 [Lachnospiraceae bacterium]|nr:hypothetical protein [Lachnospiraceae bacterium]